jgi:hypothetical protein
MYACLDWAAIPPVTVLGPALADTLVRNTLGKQENSIISLSPEGMAEIAVLLLAQ